MEDSEIKIISQDGHKYLEKSLSSRYAHPKEEDIISEYIAYQYMSYI